MLLGAEIDLQHIYSWHEERSEQSALKISEKLVKALGQLAHFPESGPMYAKPYRRLVVPRTSYAIYYQVEPKRVAVAAVVDVREDPAGVIMRLWVE